MPRPLAFALLLAGLATAGCNADPADGTDAETPAADYQAADNRALLGEAMLRSSDGSDIGSAQLYDNGSLLELQIDLGGLEPGERALHLHTTGLCEGPDFKSAGGHLNPQDNTHGSMSEGGRHLGDLPNIAFGAEGSVTQVITLDWAASGSEEAIFDEDGSAVMIHAGPDDYISDPAGAAGPRIACGVLTRNPD